MAGTHLVLESKSAFHGRILDVVVERIRLPDGREAEREIVRHPGAVGIVPVSAGGRVLLVRQQRHAVGEDLLEIPAGKLDAGEDPVECARRELLEETGYRCGEVQRLVTFFSTPGFSDEVIHLFLTTQIEPAGPPPETDEGEPISTEWLGLDDAIRAIWERAIVDGKTIIGITLSKLWLDAAGAEGPRR